MKQQIINFGRVWTAYRFYGDLKDAGRSRTPSVRGVSLADKLDKASESVKEMEILADDMVDQFLDNLEQLARDVGASTSP